MSNKIESFLIELWNQSQIVENDTPRHLIFGNFVYRHTLDTVAKAVCFHCRDGVELSKMNGQWMHMFRAESTGRVHLKESCKASAVQNMMEP